MRLRVLDKLALQNANDPDIEIQVIYNYKRVMTTFFKQQKMIPKEHYVEIKYEDLVKDPIRQVKKIYTTLNLTGLENALPRMNRYLDSKKEYKTNIYEIDEKIIHHVFKNWKFTINRWNYMPPK
jgi:hypothetical protein